jgi:hypothetical protein
VIAQKVCEAKIQLNRYIADAVRSFEDRVSGLESSVQGLRGKPHDPKTCSGLSLTDSKSHEDGSPVKASVPCSNSKKICSEPNFKENDEFIGVIDVEFNKKLQRETCNFLDFEELTTNLAVRGLNSQSSAKNLTNQNQKSNRLLETYTGICKTERLSTKYQIHGSVIKYRPAKENLCEKDIKSKMQSIQSPRPSIASQRDFISLASKPNSMNTEILPQQVENQTEPEAFIKSVSGQNHIFTKCSTHELICLDSLIDNIDDHRRRPSTFKIAESRLSSHSKNIYSRHPIATHRDQTELMVAALNHAAKGNACDL